jgi:Kef-type K+ transport system membrane component KefB
MSILEYEDRVLPLPLFFSSVGLMTGFTVVFPLLGIVTLPVAVMIVVSIVNGDISFIDEELTTSIIEEE